MYNGQPLQTPVNQAPVNTRLPTEITTGQVRLQMINNAEEWLVPVDWKQGDNDQGETYIQYRNKKDGILITSYFRKNHQFVVRCVLYGRSKTIHAIWKQVDAKIYPSVGVNEWEGNNVRIELQELKQGMAALQASIIDKSRGYY